MPHILIEPKCSPTEAELGWAAGILDGEGCIYIRPSHGKQTTACLVIHVGNTDVRMLVRLQTLFGGRIHPSNGTSRKPEWRPSWQWSISTTQSMDMLCEVRPFLICKGEEADLAIKWVESRDNHLADRLKSLKTHQRAV